MNIRSLAAGAVLSLSMVAPALANPTHLDITVGSVQQRTLVSNNTNVTAADARLSHQVNNRVVIYGDIAESLVNRSASQGVASTTYNVTTGDVGLGYAFSPNVQGHVEAGNALNNALVLPNDRRTQNYVGVSVSDRVF